MDVQLIQLTMKMLGLLIGLALPRNKLKGFQSGRIGPVDNKDYVGGNYAVSLNFDTTLPMILPSAEIN